MAPSFRQTKGWTRPKGAAFLGKARGNGSIAGLRAELAATPISVAHAVAYRGAPVITGMATASFDAGQNVYGDARPSAKGGGALTLLRSGDTRRTVKFVSAGRTIRCVLGTPYARYLIGKYGILPNGNAAVPATWREGLDRVVRDVQGGR